MAETKRMSRHDIESATTYLKNHGIQVRSTADPAERSRFDVTFDGQQTEKMTARDVWMLARGHRLGRRFAANHEQ